MMGRLCFLPGTGKPHPKSKFTQGEDELLVGLVKELGVQDWHGVSRRMPGRNARQCRDRWLNYLSPDVENGPWNGEEEQKLLDLVKQFGPSWKHIATFFPSRTDINIKSRWQLIQRRVKKEAARKVNIRTDIGRPIGKPKGFISMSPSQPPGASEAEPTLPTTDDLGYGAFDQTAMSDLWSSLMLNDDNGMENMESWF
jgi:hypothetical protein